MISSLLAILCGLVSNVITLVLTHFLQRKSGRQKLRTRQYRFRLAVIVVAVAIPCGFLAAGMIHYAQRPRTASPVLADFNSCRPVNIYGRHWDVFNDNPWNGNSNVTVSVASGSVSEGGCYAVLDYFLGERASIQPHTGMFTFFSMPGEARDVSAYSGVELRIWHEGILSGDVRVAMDLRPSEMITWSDGYFEYDLTSQAGVTKRGPTVRIPFGLFEPSVPLRAVGYSGEFAKALKSGIYEVSIVVFNSTRGQTASGRFLVDDIGFY